MTKYKQISELLATRIANGEYSGKQLPPIRQIAEDMGVSYLTARQAMNYLKDSGLVWRHETGRKTIISDNSTSRPLVAMITPLWHFTEWHRTLRNATLDCDGMIRFVAYGSATDPIINEALSSDYDLIFIVLPAGRNTRLLERISKMGDKVFVLFNDLSSQGIHSIANSDMSALTNIMQGLHDSGHRSIDLIDCENTENPDKALRKKAWLNFLEAKNITGEAHVGDAEDFEQPETASYRLCCKVLDSRPLPDAFFCLTPPIAIGLYRACYERNIRIGKDVSVFSFGEDAAARLMMPALTTVMTPKSYDMFKDIIQQYRPKHKHKKQLLYNTYQMEIFEGESIKQNQ